MSAPFQRGEPRHVDLPVNLADAYAQGDLVGVAAGGTVGFPASAQAWNTDLATTRAAFVALFAGVAGQEKDANATIYGNGQAKGLQLRLSTGGVNRYAVKAGTYKPGSLLGPAKQTGNALENQTLEVVSVEAQATHVCVGGFGTNPGFVDAEVLSRVFKPASAT